MARIGPNAVTRLAEALSESEDQGLCSRVFGEAGLACYLAEPPVGMVDEKDVIALHEALRTCAGESSARSIASRAGSKTADYLLAHRIPKAAQLLLRLLPDAAAVRLLAAVIGRNAWTFAGSGRFSIGHGAMPVLMLADSPLCRVGHSREPCCDYYAGTFERLFRMLVSDRIRIRERCGKGRSDGICRFELTLSEESGPARHAEWQHGLHERTPEPLK